MDRVVLIAGQPCLRVEELLRGLVGAGVRVALVSERPADLIGLADELGGERVWLHPGRIHSQEQASACVSATLARWGRLDALVHALGSGPVWAGAELDTDEWLQTMTRAPCLLTRAALPELRRSAGYVFGVVGECARQPRCTEAASRWLASFLRGVVAENGKFGVQSRVYRGEPDLVASCLELLAPEEPPARAA